MSDNLDIIIYSIVSIIYLLYSLRKKSKAPKAKNYENVPSDVSYPNNSSVAGFDKTMQSELDRNYEIRNSSTDKNYESLDSQGANEEVNERKFEYHSYHANDKFLHSSNMKSLINHKTRIKRTKINKKLRDMVISYEILNKKYC